MNNFDEIREIIKSDAEPGKVNIICPFVEAQSDKKLSVVGVYDNEETAIVDGRGELIEFNESDYYYGLSPAFGADEICRAIKDGAFKDSESFESFLNANAHLFTLPATMGDYAKALFAKTIIKMSTMFGYSFVCGSEDCYNHFCKIVSGVAIKDVDYDINNETKTVRLLGQSSDLLLSLLNDSFVINENNELIMRVDGEKVNLSERLYSDKLSLVQGKTYYSGVLPRVKKFIWRNLEYSNSKVNSLELKFGRSTFATLDAFYSSYIKKHRLLEKYRPILEALDEHEDALIKELSKCSCTDENIIDKVNDYLNKSYSVHNLVISGNIITVDGYVVVAEREKKAYDANTYYCSVNGQTEINDDRVDFYKQSVYEDMPTIKTNYGSRIDFMGEFERETEAELNINCPASNWNLQGISFLSILNSDSKTASYRRFHFNIFGECNTSYSLSQIIDTQKKATEKFENSKIVGVKINRHKNLFFKIFSSIMSLFKLILKSKELVTSIFAITIFFLSLQAFQNTGFTFEKASDYCGIIFTLLSLAVVIKELFVGIMNFFKRINTHLKLSIYIGKEDFYNNVHRKLAKKKVNLHPIADLLLYEYIKNS